MLGNMKTVTKKFFQAVKLSSIPAYKLSISANLHPNTLSKIIHHAVPVKAGDARLIKIGELLGLRPHEIFEPNESGDTA